MKKASILLCMCILLTTAIAYFFLPETIPTHFDLQGTADAFGNRATIFFPACISLFVTAILLLTRKIDPKKENYQRFQKPFYTVLFTVNAIIFLLIVLIIYKSFLPNSGNITSFMFLMMSLLFLVLGNIMPKFKPNYMMGIRTPWTLANETVWYKTHRFIGKIWFIGGILFFIGIFLPPSWIPIFLGCIIGYLIILPITYSYFCYQRIVHPQHSKHE